MTISAGNIGRLPLAVDMDGTLLRTDMLLETFASALFSKPLQTLLAMGQVFRGRAALKRRLAELGDFDPESLPYRQDLLDYLVEQHAAGRALHLVSASDETVVRRVGERLGIFSSIHGSVPPHNLKGRQKVERLLELFPDGFVYAGDSTADLHVWQRASGMVLAGESAGVFRAARGLQRPVEREFSQPVDNWRTWRRGLRFHHWSKNSLLFVALLLSVHRLNIGAWATCIAGFVLMGIAASATYLCNDLADLAADRRHRTKRFRPLASGDMAISQALLVSVLFLVFAILAAAALTPAFGVALVVYIATTLSYSLWLKRVALVDIVVLAWLYTLRIIMGTLLAGVVFSPWLLTFAGFFFLSLSLAKRHTELVAVGEDLNVQIPGRGYRGSDTPLTLALGVSTGVASVLIVVEYLMAEAFPSGLYHFTASLWMVPVILVLWIFRIWLLAHRGELNDDPVSFALRDRTSLAFAGILVATFVLAAAI